MSFIDTAKRVFIGRDYEDDYDDYDDYEDEYEEEPRKRLFSFLKKDDEDDYEEPQQRAPERRSVTPSRPRQSFSAQRTVPSAYDTRKTTPPIVRDLTGVEVTLITPTSFDDSIKIVREVKEGRIVIFDVSEIQENNEARRIVDYICGAAEGIDCPFSRICPSIFCIAPKGVVMSGKKQRY